MSISPDQIALTPDQRQQLARLAEQSGKPWDAVLAEALSSYEHAPRPQTESAESVFDAMIRLGVLGAVKDGPLDLSTKPEYMERVAAEERGESLQLVEGKPLWQVVAEAAAALPAEIAERLPTDGAEQHDHYIYGVPRRPQP